MTQNSGEQDGQQQRRPMRLENSVFFPGKQRRCGFSSNTGESKTQKSLEENAESDEVPDKLQLEKASLQTNF